MTLGENEIAYVHSFRLKRCLSELVDSCICMLDENKSENIPKFENQFLVEFFLCPVSVKYILPNGYWLIEGKPMKAEMISKESKERNTN